MPMTIIGLSSIALCMVGLAGGLNDLELWNCLMLLLPFAIAGVWLGHQLALRIQAAFLKPFIYSFLCLSGLVLCARSLRGFVL